MGTPKRTSAREPGGVSVVIPTIGRPSLAAVLAVLAQQLPTDWPVELLIADDRRNATRPLAVAIPPALAPYARILTGPGRGPAAARNAGWRAARHGWVAFLDDDVLPGPDWLAELRRDLAVPAGVGGVQGRVRVPMPAHRRPTDWERVTAGLAAARWITADMAYRRAVLAATGGFDERFRRAFREDAELAHRVRAAGWTLARGRRWVAHPVRPEGPWVSLRAQRGNADDALLRRMYGPKWRRRLAVPAGRRRRHAAVAGAGLVALGCAAVSLAVPAGRRRSWRVAGALAAAGWLAGTAEFATARIAPGPGTVSEIVTMAVTSALIPPLAVAHWLRGWCATGPTGPSSPLSRTGDQEISSSLSGVSCEEPLDHR